MQVNFKEPVYSISNVGAITSREFFFPVSKTQLDEYMYHLRNSEKAFSMIESLLLESRELDLLRERFSNLPMRNDTNYVTWFGDTAKFIVANW